MQTEQERKGVWDHEEKNSFMDIEYGRMLQSADRLWDS